MTADAVALVAVLADQLGWEWDAAPGVPSSEEVLLSVAHAVIDAGFVRQSDPFGAPLDREPETLADGSQIWPGDDRFAVTVRTVYSRGDAWTQIVHATSLVEALGKAAEVPFAEWAKGAGVR